MAPELGVVLLELVSGQEPVRYKLVNRGTGEYERTSLIDTAAAAVAEGDGEGMRRWVLAVSSNPHAVHQSPLTVIDRVPFAACGVAVAPRELLLLLGSQPLRPGLRCPCQPPTPRGGRHGSLASGASASAARKRCAPRTPSRRCRRYRGPCQCASSTSCSRPDTATSTYGTDGTAQPRSLFHLSVLNPMVVERRGVEEQEHTFFYS
ncbi:unnamed protein product [Miscanthus lutarioriparius]|uniref:Uncharacterized protein n=1 Tax=Miscanthus lutarioriparius TaxID=422564 RepID=A0A811QP90_9POAL|nr:unnamed protein product [Miscanthus lutarioriparius]